jgi:RHS repeat-associated protein
MTHELLWTEGGLWASDTVTNYYNTARMRSGLGLQQPTGARTNGFTYDSGHRLATVISPAGTFTYAYKGPGNLVTNLALPNNSRITNAFDSVGRLSTTRLLTSGDSLLNSYAYIYNLAGQRTNLTRTDGSRVTNTYDNLGQLQSAKGSGGQSTENLGYLYDTAWNLNKRTNNGAPTTFAVNVKNELTTVAGYGCVYDNNGNLTSRQTAGSSYVYYGYDDENQLTSVATDTYGTPTGSRWRYTFTYDGRGRLRKRVDYTWNTYPPGSWQESGQVRYVYDGMRVIQERSSANTPTVAYTRGNDLSGSLEGAGGIGGLLARSHGYSGGAFSTHSFYHADGNGNVTYLETSAQGLAASYRYDPYGNTLYSGGTLASANTYRFSSKEQMPNSGLYYYGYRFYDPNLQRWLNRDPLGEEGGFNLYGFVRNKSVGSFDPLGLRSGELIPAAPDPQWDGCNDWQKRWVRNQFKRLCEKLKKDKCHRCLNEMGDDPRYQLVSGTYPERAQHYCEDPDELTVRCPRERVGVCAPTDGDTTCGVNVNATTIIVCPDGWMGRHGCGSLFCTIAHELGHVIGGSGNVGNEFAKCFGCPPGKPE